MTRFTILACFALLAFVVFSERDTTEHANAVTEPHVTVSTKTAIGVHALPALEVPDQSPVLAISHVVSEPVPAEPIPDVTPEHVSVSWVYRPGGAHRDMSGMAVSSRDAPEGYLAARNLASLLEEAGAERPGSEVNIWFVSGQRVNLRAGPSTNDAVIGKLTRGMATEVIAVEGEWARLRVQETGAEGFMVHRLLYQ